MIVKNNYAFIYLQIFMQLLWLLFVSYQKLRTDMKGKKSIFKRYTLFWTNIHYEKHDLIQV